MEQAGGGEGVRSLLLWGSSVCCGGVFGRCLLLCLARDWDRLRDRESLLFVGICFSDCWGVVAARVEGIEIRSEGVCAGAAGAGVASSSRSLGMVIPGRPLSSRSLLK